MGKPGAGENKPAKSGSVAGFSTGQPMRIPKRNSERNIPEQPIEIDLAAPKWNKKGHGTENK